MNTYSTVTVDQAVDRNQTPQPPGVRLTPAAVLPWANAGVIATPGRERAFTSELAARCSGVTEPHARQDVTAVLNALRGGLTLGELLDQLPGLRPGRLYDAYLTLDSLRRDAVTAWTAICDGSDVAALDEHGDRAARIVPVMIDRLRRSARIDPDKLGRVVDILAAGVADVRAEIISIEHGLALGVGEPTAQAMSLALYNLNADCLFGRPDHLPARVGALMPTHVAALLGERAMPEAQVA